MRQAHLPSVLRGPAYPLTVYAPSRAHESYLVVYGPHWPSRSSWIVPGTHPDFPGYEPRAAHLECANDDGRAA